MASLVQAVLFTFATHTFAQSISDLGVSGGNGSRGGIGDGDHPVMHAQAYITDAMIPLAPNTTRQLAQGTAPVLSRTNNSGTCGNFRFVVVDSTSNGARQQMVGFGHAWTDSAVDVFNTLQPAVLDQVMNDLFGQSGNNMGFMRHTIGSSDLSGAQYSYDDNGPSFNEGEPDPSLANFSLGQYGTAMAQMIAKMGTYKGDVFLFGAPWSLPGWMKNNDLFIAGITNTPGGQYPLLNNSFNIGYIPQAVEYFTKYIDAFAQYGVTINGLSLENEPLNYQGGYPTMYLDAADEANILNQGLGSMLQQRGVLAMAYDHNTDQPVYPYRVLQGAPSYAHAVAWHCYQGPYPNYTVMADISRAFPGTLQFMTECSNYLPAAGSVNFEVAENFIPPVQQGASGAAMWVMATDPDFGPHSPYGGCNGCLGSIVVNSSTTYTKTNDYYMIGQFSRFVRRGSVNYNVLRGNEGSGATSNQFYVMSVQNPDGSWAVVFMNNMGSDQDVVLSFTGQGNQFWEGVVPSQTVTTWLIPSQQVLNQVNGTKAASTVPPYPFTNTTSIPLTGSTTIAVCNITTATTSSSSSSTSTTALPVPDTTHTIATTSMV
ncbi:glycoside hydrolase family 30 protein [Baudoinia panamericana UAMH 10762]|uniref:Glycoside hydrolase family 30 protein n=1 Tax=Baudoinia panamericana (strain UAMH 10762) TaxID=717646 RepID=M2NCY6_BAUPA|nr:glycoside hydrolase family 30 protein [Baudoinia panamericana UAMH 10762]EMC96790.1 glycoside hydrolase family 30 protein [Baudoinia panamericana UAMH 10762]